MPFVLSGVVKIPKKNSFIEGAMLEPVNTVLKAVKKLALLRGDSVLVIGQGPIGLMFTKLFALRGMRVMASDLLEQRLKLAKQWGAKVAISADAPDFVDQVKRSSNGRGVDAVVVAVPVDAAVKQAQECVRGGGQTMLFAHTRAGVETGVDLASVCVQEKDLLGSYSSDFTLQEEVARLVFGRRLNVQKLVTDEFPLEATAAAIELASLPNPKSLKIMVMQK
jgi:L-iditol 2-dehydrogenase